MVRTSRMESSGSDDERIPSQSHPACCNTCWQISDSHVISLPAVGRDARALSHAHLPCWYGSKHRRCEPSTDKISPPAGRPGQYDAAHRKRRAGSGCCVYTEAMTERTHWPSVACLSSDAPPGFTLQEMRLRQHTKAPDHLLPASRVMAACRCHTARNPALASHPPHAYKTTICWRVCARLPSKEPRVVHVQRSPLFSRYGELPLLTPDLPGAAASIWLGI